MKEKEGKEKEEKQKEGKEKHAEKQADYDALLDNYSPS